jgi:hypothetical protein
MPYELEITTNHRILLLWPFYEVGTYNLSSITRDRKLFGITVWKTKAERDSDSYVWYETSYFLGRPVKLDIFEGYREITYEMDRMRQRKTMTKEEIDESVSKILAHIGIERRPVRDFMNAK